MEATASLVNNASNTNANINAAGGVSPGFRHGTEGTVKILRPQVTSLVLTSGSLIIDTSQATITHSDGAFLSGTFEDRSYTHTDGTVYAYKVCVFTADEISLGSGVLVTLQGSNPLSLRTRNHGDFTLSTQLIANGSDGDNGSTDTPGKIGGYAGARKGSYNGYGPGKGANRQENNDGTAGGYGNIGQKAGHTTATYGNIYGDYFLDDLLGGSGGGGGQYQGGGSGGGAIELIAHGTGVLKLDSGARITVNGGDTASNNRGGGGGSGGSIRLAGGSIENNGQLEAPVGVVLNRVELQILMVRVVELLLIVMEQLKLVHTMSLVIRFSIVTIILCTRIMTVPFPCVEIQV